MFDTRKADAYDRKNYKSTPRDNDIGILGAIANGTRSQQAKAAGAIVGGQKFAGSSASKSSPAEDAPDMSGFISGRKGSGVKGEKESYADFIKRHPLTN